MDPTTGPAPRESIDDVVRPSRAHDRVRRLPHGPHPAGRVAGREIAAALEEDEHQGAAWARRARRARPRQEPELPPSSETQQPAPPPEAPAAADSGPEQATSPLSSDENSEQASAAQTPPAAAPRGTQVRRRWVVPIMLVGPETSLALMPVNIAGALVWGYGARRWG